jgi:hypothetical protein
MEKPHYLLLANVFEVLTMSKKKILVVDDTDLTAIS